MNINDAGTVGSLAMFYLTKVMADAIAYLLATLW